MDILALALAKKINAGSGINGGGLTQQDRKKIVTIEQKVKNLESLADGSLYMSKKDAIDAYEKFVPDDAIEGTATLDKLGGKTLVWNQYVVRPETTTDLGSITTNYKAVEKTDEYIAITLSASNRNSVGFVLTNKIKGLLKAGHKHLVVGKVKASSNATSFGVRFNYSTIAETTVVNYPVGNDYVTVYGEMTPLSDEYRAYVYCNVNSTIAEDDTIYGKQFCIYDLTQMFGAGNEPDAETFRAMFPADYYPYSEPTLMSFGTHEVVSKGRNLLNQTGSVLGDLSASRGTVITNEGYRTTGFLPLVGGVDYTRANARVICFYDMNKQYISGVNVQGTPNGNTKSPVGAAFFRFTSQSTVLDNCYFGIGNATPYRAPITTDLHPLMAKYFQDGMKSAGDVHDEIDLERGVAVKRVESIKFADVTIAGDWYFNTNRSQMSTSKIGGVVRAENWVNAVYANSGLKSITDMVSGTYQALVDSFFINDDSFADRASAYDAIKNIVWYRPMATPIETPIDPADLDGLTDLNVEAGGSLVFKNGSDDHRVPLPNQVTYKIKLAPGGYDDTTIKARVKAVEDALIGVDAAADALMEVVGV